MIVQAPTAYADHPGIIGPVSHLGVETVIRVMLAALLDGLNPTAIGIMLFICYRAKKGQATKQAVLYILGLLITYTFAGVLLRLTYSTFGPNIPIMVFQLIIAGLLFLSGLQELMVDNSNSKKTFEIPEFLNKLLGRFDWLLNKGLSLIIGLIIGVVELFATGAIYLSFIQAVSYDKTAPWWVTVVTMIIYLAVFTIPLVVALSYRHLLIADGESITSARTQKVRKIAGVIFMLVAIVIAASAIVTIQAIA